MSLKDLCARYDLSLNPASIGAALLKSGIMREIHYTSTTGSGEQKSFKEISPEHMNYGINRKSLHEFKTEPRFYVDSFLDLLKLAVDQINAELEAVRMKD